MLWGSLNAGPEQLWDANGRLTTSLLNLIHGARSLLWLPAGIGAIWMMLMRGALPSVLFSGPLALMTLYALIGIVSTLLFSPGVSVAMYWAASYVSVCLVLGAVVAGDESPERMEGVILANWAIMAATAVVLVAIGWDVISAGSAASTPDMMPGYGVLGKKPDVAGMPMVRASGVGRYAAVMGIVCLSRLLLARGRPYRLLWALPLLFSWFAVIVHQSRSAVFGIVAASLVVVLLHISREPKVLALAALAMLVTVIYVFGLPPPVAKYVARGQEASTYYDNLTGRMVTWDEGWDLIKEAPALGYGFHADRFLLKRQRQPWFHIHNALLQALLQTGFTGAVPFVAAFVAAWLLLFRALHSISWLPAEQRTLLIETAGVLTFLTVRSIPESTGAFFGPDWLLLAPIFAYLQILGQRRPAVAQVPLAYRPHYAARRFYAPAAFYRH
jgi:O-antigen ligase